MLLPHSILRPQASYTKQNEPTEIEIFGTKIIFCLSSIILLLLLLLMFLSFHPGKKKKIKKGW